MNSELFNNDQLDAALREIAVPEGLAARLKGITVPSDDELDEMLCGLAMPESLSLSLHAIPEDELLDRELQEVITPFTLRESVQLKTRDERWREAERWLVKLSLAAVLFVAVSMTLFTSTAAYLSSIYPPAAEPQWVVLQTAPETWQGALVDLPVVDEGINIEVPAEAFFVATPAMESPADAGTLLPNWDESLRPSGPAGAVAEWQAQLHRGLRPMDDVIILKFGLLGAPHYAEDELPELMRLRLPIRSGLELPLVRGYDRTFLLKEGIFPPIPVLPQTDARLLQVSIPLSTSTAALDLTEMALATGKLPRPDVVRAEEFLAGLESRLPAAPAGRLALHVHGGPSPFGPADALLVQVAAQAGKLHRETKQGTHLVIAVDTSATMARGRRLEMVQQAIEQVHRQLGPRDALSLLAFDEEVVCRVEHLNASQGEDLHDQLRELLPRGGTNLAAGLQTAASVALTEPALLAGMQYRRRLVLITDSRATMPDSTAEKITQVLTLISADGVGLDVLDVSGRTQPDSRLQQWTELLGGSYRSLGTRQGLFASLVESLAGHNPAVANEAQLKIQFNPQAVIGYRLIGHEPNLVAQVVPVSADAQLLPQECAGALLEIWPKPGAAFSLPLGHALVSWKDPRTGAKHEQKLPLDRKHFAMTFNESAVPLQTAAVAAEIAEQLRGSREALRQAGLFTNLQPRNNTSTIKTVIRPWSTIRHEPDLQRLLSVLEQMERIRGR